MLTNQGRNRALRSRALLALLLAFSLSGCASSYQPANSPRIALKQDGGWVLVRDGYEYPVGMFGSSVVDAVQGNPTAEAHARSYRNSMIAGWSLYGVGLGATVAGLGIANAAEPDSSQETTGGVLILAGVGALITSIVFLAQGSTELWDAINIYNDGIDARLRQQFYQLPAEYPATAPVPALPVPSEPVPATNRSPAAPPGTEQPTAPVPAPAPQPPVEPTAPPPVAPQSPASNEGVVSP